MHIACRSHHDHIRRDLGALCAVTNIGIKVKIDILDWLGNMMPSIVSTQGIVSFKLNDDSHEPLHVYLRLSEMLNNCVPHHPGF